MLYIYVIHVILYNVVNLYLNMEHLIFETIITVLVWDIGQVEIVGHGTEWSE